MPEHEAKVITHSLWAFSLSCFLSHWEGHTRESWLDSPILTFFAHSLPCPDLQRFFGLHATQESWPQEVACGKCQTRRNSYKKKIKCDGFSFFFFFNYEGWIFLRKCLGEEKYTQVYTRFRGIYIAAGNAFCKVKSISIQYNVLYLTAICTCMFNYLHFFSFRGDISLP